MPVTLCILFSAGPAITAVIIVFVLLLAIALVRFDISVPWSVAVLAVAFLAVGAGTWSAQETACEYAGHPVAAGRSESDS